MNKFIIVNAPQSTDRFVISNSPTVPQRFEVQAVYRKGEDGLPFTYEDFTPEQLVAIQQPALDAAAIAITAAGNANDAATNAITAASNANTAAAIAENAKGWTPVSVFEADGDRIVKKLSDYVGGTGDKPTDNVGMYFKSDGTFTADISEAADFRGTQGESGVIGTETMSEEDYDDLPAPDPELIYYLHND